MERLLKLETVTEIHKLGDILTINDERWIVERIIFDGHAFINKCIPLTSFICKSTYLSQIPEYQTCTLADIIRRICDEYERNINS